MVQSRVSGRTWNKARPLGTEKGRLGRSVHLSGAPRRSLIPASWHHRCGRPMYGRSVLEKKGLAQTRDARHKQWL